MNNAQHILQTKVREGQYSDVYIQLSFLLLCLLLEIIQGPT